jgi:MFS family permease
MGTSWKRLLALEVSAFGFFGLFAGCYAVLLADLSGALGLSPGPLGIALFVGAGAAIAKTVPALVVGGFLLVGVAPVAFSVAGNMVPKRAGSAVSVVTTIGYGGFLLGPPLVGAWQRRSTSGPPSGS